jgi:hypothetical protein
VGSPQILSGEVIPHRKIHRADQTVSVPGNAKRLLGLKNVRRKIKAEAGSYPDFRRKIVSRGN